MTDSITINAHSSIRLDLGEVLYFDPFHIEKATKDGDILFFTHDHYDHLSPEDVEKVAKDNTVFVTPLSVLEETVEKLGVSEDRVFGMRAGETMEIQGIKIEAVAAYNLEGRKQFHPFEKQYLGYIVEQNGVRYYVAGDSDATEEAKSVKCNVALIPIGGTYTMTWEDAVDLIEAIKPDYVVPTHYGDIVGTVEDASSFAKELATRVPDTRVVLKIEP